MCTTNVLLQLKCEYKGSQRNLAASAHKKVGRSTIKVADANLSALLQPSSAHVSQNTSLTEVWTDDGAHAVSLFHTHVLSITSCSLAETWNVIK